MITPIFLASLAFTSVPVFSLDGDVTFDLTYYYPGGYVPGVAPGGFVVVDVYVDTSALPDNSTGGMHGWGLKVTVNSSVLTPLAATGGSAGYFLYDWSEANYPPSFPGGPLQYPPQFLSLNGSDYIECSEFFVPLPPTGAGNSTGKLCTLYFTSKSVTAYSPLIIDVANSGYQDANGDLYEINAINGHYARAPPILTVESTPIDGINFTIDSETYMTNSSVGLPEGSYTVTMPSTWMVGSDKYNFVEWEDTSTNPVRTVDLTSNMTIIATYQLAKEYTLTVNSVPITGINFTVDGVPNTTNWSSLLLEGDYIVAMPSTWTVGSDKYTFSHWEDASTNPVRTITLTSNMTVNATYVHVYSLTVESTPIDNIDFTIDTISGKTNATVELIEGSYNITILDFWPNPVYYFSHWEDASTNPVRTITLTSNMTITATYRRPKKYMLTVNSEPITGINFTVGGTANTTNWSDILLEVEYLIDMSSTWTTVGGDVYEFKHWEDNSTSPMRTFLLSTNMTITATYELAFANPTASFIFSPTEPVVDETVTFDATASEDPDGTVVSYLWEFGDGISDNGTIVEHAYTTAGTYDVTLTVTDDDGLSHTTTKSVTVTEAPPSEVPLELYLAAAGVIAIVIVAIAFYYLRSRKTKPA